MTSTSPVGSVATRLAAAGSLPRDALDALIAAEATTDGQAAHKRRSTIYQRKDGRREAAVCVITPDGEPEGHVYGSTWDDIAVKRARLITKDRQGIPAEGADKARDFLAY